MESNPAETASDAPGGPGLAPRWTSSDKSGVGTALSPTSQVWFTISHGVLNEVYYPRVDAACTRDFGLIVTDGQPGGLFAEEKRDTATVIATIEEGVPAYCLANTHKAFRIDKRIVTDPRYSVLLQRVAFTPGRPGLRLFALLAPHLVNGGAHNTAWLGEYKGDLMLFAEGDGTSLALACSTGWAARSVGFVGESDGWTLLHRDGVLRAQYERAANGNVALTGEIVLPDSGVAVLALGFGRSWSEAAFRARAGLLGKFEAAEKDYSAAWRAWQATLRPLTGASTTHHTYKISTAVLRCHDSPSFPGGLIASLSIPWGYNKGDDDLGGYHLVWPRDLVETAGGLLAAGALVDARRVLDYLRIIQLPDGGWTQNCWLDGTPYWRGVQMDECAFPILLVDMCRRHGALPDDEVADYWPMVRAAAAFVLRHGPVTGQDRWEEDGGYTPFTLAVEIAGLLVAAELAEEAGEPALGALCRDTADAWNEAIESWCFAPGSPPARAAGVSGHYVRIAPDIPGTAAADVRGSIAIKNRPPEKTNFAADLILSPDALALVRFGLRRADDPRMVATVAVIDATLRRELPAGPCWYRYNEDGYGEHEDGRAFDGTGIGRLWPLLTGERAFYELAAGRPDEARRLLATMEGLTSDGFMMPEQVWDSPAVPSRELYLGRPTGGAMPLVWAHSEHIKLCRSLADGAVFDCPPQTLARYAEGGTPARVQPWRPDWKAATVAAGRVLRLDLAEPTQVTWSADGWATSATVSTTDTGVGLHVAELDVSAFPPGREIRFRAGGEHSAVIVEAPR